MLCSINNRRLTSGQKSSLCLDVLITEKTYEDPYLSFKILKDFLIVVSRTFGYCSPELSFLFNLIV